MSDGTKINLLGDLPQAMSAEDLLVLIQSVAGVDTGSNPTLLQLATFLANYFPSSPASQAEAEAGADNAKWMSPLRVAQAIAALAASGGGGGLLVNWAIATPPTSVSGSGAFSATPLITEGAQVATLTITPKSTANTLLFFYAYTFSNNSTSNIGNQVALFRGSNFLDHRLDASYFICNHAGFFAVNPAAAAAEVYSIRADREPSGSFSVVNISFICLEITAP